MPFYSIIKNSDMKRLSIILVGLCLFIAVPATAQLDFGIKAGLNFSEKPTNIKGIKEGHTGWYAGPMIKFIAPIIGLGVEADALYSNSGTSIGGERFNKNSIEIPVYLRYELRLPAIKKVIIPFVAVGPQWGYTFGKKEYGKKLVDIESWEDLKEVSDRYFKFNESCFSLNVGLGVILFKHLQLNANYNIALGDTSEYFGIENFNWGDKLETIKSQNNIWQLSVAYIF